jgi:uncharacterized protein
MKNALILMTRIPVEGKTKTRLMSDLSGLECAQIHMCFLKDIFNVLNYVKDDIDIYLTYTPEDPFKIIECVIPNYISCFPQYGDNLGDRMSNALKHVLSKNYNKVLLIGCDIPHIQPENIIKAYDKLNYNDLCLGPTLDGGYYLVGMKKPIDIIFDNNLKWGYKTVLEGTLGICNKNNIKVGLTDKLIDIDTKDDLMHLFNEICSNKFKNKIMPTSTAKFILSREKGTEYAKRYIER